MQKTVGHILERKGTDVWTVSSDATVYEALTIMAERNIGALVVVDDGAIVGIMSERDYARKVVLHDLGSKSTPVGRIMTPDPITVDPGASVSSCMEVMTENRFRHLPVVESGVLRGVISIGDVVNAVMEEQRFLIDQLEGYITS